ncbi:MAG: hypothetical protein QOF44_1608, partial [Streptomyces sp.]|nr:hypothetical protein [Streptomyces sp.]
LYVTSLGTAPAARTDWAAALVVTLTTVALALAS